MSAFAAVILEAGRSSRFSGVRVDSKLTALWRGEPMIRHVARLAIASGAAPVIVVTGCARASVEAALGGLDLTFVHNAAFAGGLSSSLRAGVEAVPEAAHGALVLLGDMPLVKPATLGALMQAATASPSYAAVVPTYDGRPGNPVLLARRFFPELDALEGDCGAGALLRRSRHVLCLAVCDRGVTRDVDTWEDFVAAAS